ncbi:MAG: hypothetical protein R8K53_03290 [Mariprofundaceae bacterium]
MIRLCWKKMRIVDADVLAGDVARGEILRLVMPRRHQLAWLQMMLEDMPERPQQDSHVWLETPETTVGSGSEMFFRRVVCLLHQQGVLANLSLRENLLLPFLYRGAGEEIQRADDLLPEMADWLGIGNKLDEQAGERSGYMHALISLGRAMLMKPDILIVQDIHVGMQMHQLQRLRILFGEALARLGSGVLYLSSSAHDGMEIDFCRSLELTTVCAENE